MLISTSIPTEEERSAALQMVPWHLDIRSLTGYIFGALKNQAVDLIDASVGERNHIRASLVALYEGIDTLQQATIDLAESALREQVFTRVDPVDPLAFGPPSKAEDRERLPWRFSRFAVEDAAVRAATAIDHFANAHVRLAWEVNAATRSEVNNCAFDPSAAEPRSWISTGQLHAGIRRANSLPLGVFSSFSVNDTFLKCLQSQAARELRSYRHQILHRDRPAYREYPALGRTTVWNREAVVIRFPASHPDELPQISDYRNLVGIALRETLSYAEELWRTMTRFLATIGVSVIQEVDEVRVTVGLGGKAKPRENRDPGPFLSRS